MPELATVDSQQLTPNRTGKEPARMEFNEALSKWSAQIKLPARISISVTLLCGLSRATK
jgi:hypothetical protein